MIENEDRSVGFDGGCFCTVFGEDNIMKGCEHCTIIGSGARPEHFRTKKNEILIVARNQRLLFSEGSIFFNDRDITDKGLL